MESPGNIDIKILEYLNFDDGFYLEVGANNGLIQSNTVLLERNKNWKGILIEPSIFSYKECIKNRSDKNIFINCALVSKEFKDKYVYGDFDGNLMSSIDGKRLKNNNIVPVVADTLENIFIKNNIKKIDFISLDVEGYELNVLNGINFDAVDISFFLIEVYNKDYDNIVNFLFEKNYELVSNLSGFNYVDNPFWDGTHNDYLFKKIN